MKRATLFLVVSLFFVVAAIALAGQHVYVAGQDPADLAHPQARALAGEILGFAVAAALGLLGVLCLGVPAADHTDQLHATLRALQNRSARTFEALGRIENYEPDTVPASLAKVVVEAVAFVVGDRPSCRLVEYGEKLTPGSPLVEVTNERLTDSECVSSTSAPTSSRN